MDIKDLLKDAYREDMTVEELVSALESIELPSDNSEELIKLKNALANSNKEAADYKKQLREKLTADELKAKEDAEEREKLQSERDALLKRVTISDNKSKLIGLGYDEKLASETAEAMFDGDTEKVFANQQKHLENVAKKIRADILKETPKPSGGNSDKKITKEQFNAMGYGERQELFETNPNLYSELTGGNE